MKQILPLILATFVAIGMGVSSQAQDRDWNAVKRPYFSFSYPSGWQLNDITPGNWIGLIVKAEEPGGHHSIVVSFERGLVNRPSTLNQCATLDEYLEGYYKEIFGRLDPGNRFYPFTAVTHDDIRPGWLGGRGYQVSIVYQQAYQNPVTHLAWVEVIPRADGFYLISYYHPSEPMEVSEPFRKKLFGTIVFASKPLDRNAYCNYLGK
jgi:hypothetical protein